MLEAGLGWQAATGHVDAAVLDPRVRSTPRAARGRAGLLVAVEVSLGLGAPAAEVLRCAADGARLEEEASRQRDAAVAGPLSSARIVGALPLAGPLLAALLGVDALGVLIGTQWGRACLVAGLALLALSWWWSRRLVAVAASAAGAGRTDVDDATVCGLLAAVLAAGTGTASALRGVAAGLARVPGADPAGRAQRLRVLADGLDVGDLRLVDVGPALQPLLEAVAFSTATGTPAGRSLRVAAVEVRRETDAAARAATARLAARLVLPLGSAALPGFLLLGIAPVVVRLLGTGLG